MDKEETLFCKSCSKEPVGKVPVSRVIEKLDICFSTDDLTGAEALLDYWESEGHALGDERGLLSVLNEKIGLYRRCQKEEKGIAAVEEALALVDSLGLAGTFAGGTILLNAATTLKAFGRAKEALPLYRRAEAAYRESLAPDSYEWAALYNNMALTCEELADSERAEELYQKAIALLEKEGQHDGEIAVSYVNLAHLYDRSCPEDKDRVKGALSSAWEFLNSPRQPHDSNYAFICSKCAPSFTAFGWEDEGEALAAVAKEIYEGS